MTDLSALIHIDLYLDIDSVVYFCTRHWNENKRHSINCGNLILKLVYA